MEMRGTVMHDHHLHLDRMRRLFIPVQSVQGDNAKLTYFSRYGAASLADAESGVAYASVRCPADFISDAEVSALLIATCNGDASIIGSFYYSAIGEAYNTHGVLGTTETKTISNLQMMLSNKTSLPDFAIGDTLGIYFKRFGAVSSDTLPCELYVLGFVLDYMADQ